MASTLQLRNFAQKCKFPTSGKLEYLTMVNLLPTSNHWLSWVTGSFWILLQFAIVPTTPSSPCMLTCCHCACTVAFSYVWSGVMSLHPLPELFFLEKLSLELCAIFSVRPSLPSACVTPSPYFPLIFTIFLSLSVHLITFLGRHELSKIRVLCCILKGFRRLNSTEFLLAFWQVR